MGNLLSRRTANLHFFEEVEVDRGKVEKKIFSGSILPTSFRLLKAEQAAAVLTFTKKQNNAGEEEVGVVGAE